MMKIYTVGGAVRDELLGLEPKDVDYVVVGSTTAEMIAAGFSQVGADFPVFLDTNGNEYALARFERKTGYGYLGFTTDTNNVTIEDDLMRRDLTINAMAKDSDGSIIDPFDGRSDLANKVLRHVSPAFSEDPLRVIRLARFYARYSDFKIAVRTKFLCAVLVEKGDLNSLAIERFWAELHKVFTEKRPDRFFDALWEFGADMHVKFFNELYGPMLVSSVGRLGSIALCVVHLPEDMRVMIHTALTAINGVTLQTAESRTQALHKNVSTLRKLNNGVVTSEKIFNLLKQAKAWSNGPHIGDLEMAMEVANKAGEFFQLTPDELLEAVRVTADVTSADYMHIHGPGKALGAAIEHGRKQAISTLFNLHDDIIA